MPNVMTQNKNAEIVRRGYQAFNAADMKTLTELFDEKATWHVPGKIPMSATTRAATPSSPISPGSGRRPVAPSGPNCADPAS